MKKLLLVGAALLIAAVTVPLWGSCDLNAKVCRGWCEVRHLNEDMKVAGCRARCSADKIKCLAGQGTSSVDDFVEGFDK